MRTDRGEERREERKIVPAFFRPTCHGNRLGLKERRHNPMSIDPHQLVKLHDLGAESAQGYPYGP
jgi:hypothetical protein